MFTRTARKGRLRRIARGMGLGSLLVVAIAVAGCVQVQSGDDGGFTMGGRVTVDEGDTARDDIVALGANVRIDGRATRDVVVIGGRLIINGEVERSVTAVGTQLVLGPGARVGRDVVVVGGSFDRRASARIGGEFINVSMGYGAGDFFAPMNFGGGGWWGFTPFAWIGRTTQLFYWLMLALLAVALAGDRVSSASHAISREPLRMFAIGVVGIFALCCAFLILLVLSVLIIGIPFLLALLFMWWLAYIFGSVAIFQAVGNRVMNMVGRPDASQIGIVLAGGLLLGILRYVPFFGSMLWFVVALVGLGSVFATRFGTGRPWIRRSGAAQAAAAPPYAPAPAAEPEPAAGDSVEFEDVSGPAAGEISYEEREVSEETPEDDESR